MIESQHEDDDDEWFPSQTRKRSIHTANVDSDADIEYTDEKKNKPNESNDSE